MIKKKDLLMFLGLVENKAIGSVTLKYKPLIDAAEKKALEPYQSKIDSIQKRINSIFTDVQNLVIPMKEDKNTGYSVGYNNSVEGMLRKLEGVKAVELILSNCDFENSTSLIYAERDKEIKEVKDNYKKVRVVCEGLENGKKVAEYLKGLGFDLSNLEKEEQTALVADIDKSKLFVCGDNK
jgi:vacuolar-type H+-ATPase subunit I/STV1